MDHRVSCRPRRRPAGLLLALLALAAAGRPAAASEAALAQLDFRQVVRGAKERVFPAVVFVKVLRETHAEGRKLTTEVSGSGVLIGGGGELLTNWHVVDKAVEIRCLLYDGRAYPAEVLGTDKDMDLALVKLRRPAADREEALPHAALGASGELREGDFVMAMGAPWGLSRSVSIGIISCTRRYLPQNSEYSLWLQTDAAISPGNSGGPLINTAGEIVGINTLAVLWGGDMGFSIPADTIRSFLPQLRRHGQVNWTYTGVQLQPLRDFERNIYFEGEAGVIVAGTDPDSPARRAGLRPRDRLLSVAGTPVTAVTEEDLPAVRRVLGTLPKDEEAALVLRRGEERLELVLKPRAKGKVEGEELDCPRWDMTVKSINRFENPELYFYRQEGVFVFGVEHPGNAANAGLQQGDILLRVGEEPIAALADVETVYRRALEEIGETHRLLVTVLRHGLMRKVVLEYSRDYENE
jgi:serine protease Do